MVLFRIRYCSVCLLALAAAGPAAAQSGRMALDKGWTVQSSSKITQTGDLLSRPGVDVTGWHKAVVPATVVAALVENGQYRDPYFGMNLRSIPGTTYPIGSQFANLPMPPESPFRVTWWYRKEFEIPATSRGRYFQLHFDGINYRANIWLNGRPVASQDEIAGAYRRYELDVTSVAKAGGTNVLAVEVTAPEPGDLGINWVDWNPTPPDKNMGLWGNVYLTSSGPLTIRHPHVLTDLDVPALDRARLTVRVEVANASAAPASGTLRGSIGDVRFSRRVSLAAHERKTVTFSPESVASLTIRKPRLWWPYRMGPQNLYTLSLDIDADGRRSDRLDVRFGIERITSELTAEGHRLFRINGRRILIRGGGWAPDMLMRPPSPQRLEAELRYTRDMGLNTIRLEGKLERDEFFDLADRYGILIMPGWCCCDQWEKWDRWDAEDRRVGPASLRDQIRRLRNHPSVFVWLNGSDNPPPEDVERDYFAVLNELDWRKPIVSSATEKKAASGPSGVKMRGPYDYVPPSYWLTDTRNGGAFGFATEIGPGGAVPPLASLRQMLPEDKVWPINEVWNFHYGGGQFKDLKLFTEALEARYGKAAGAAEYARKAQALAYDGERAMFEGYARNKYTSTGVIQWMLNNAWPSMLWHLYDYYLRPGGGYFGTKKACEALHVQYSYDDRSVAVVNDMQEGFTGLTVTAQVYDLNAVERSTSTATVNAPADSVTRALVLPPPSTIETTTYFVRLELTDAGGKTVSRNFYWLSTKEDVLDWAGTKWYYTPTKVHADLTALAQLPATDVAVSLGPVHRSQRIDSTVVTLRNTGKAVAFQIELRLRDARLKEDVLPVFWEDNYISLMPGESRDVRVSWFGRARPLRVAVEADGWNASIRSTASARSERTSGCTASQRRDTPNDPACTPGAAGRASAPSRW